jgi:predicted XRE-type DNA-binding protein
MVTKMKHKNIGESFDSFLEEEGILEQVEDVAIKRVIALQVEQEINKRGLTKSRLAREMKTSRSSLDRLLDPDNDSVTLKTMKKAANFLGKKIILQLV